MGIAGPGADVDDVEGLVEQIAKSAELRDWRERSLDVEGVGGERAWGREGVES